MRVLSISLLALSVSSFSFNPLNSIFKSKRGLNNNVCDKGNSGALCTGVENCPPCWIKNGNKFDCYEFGTDGLCPFEGMTNRKPNTSPFPAKACFKANNIDQFCHTEKEACPPCWKLNGKKYDCYDKKDGKCEWNDMIDTSAVPGAVSQGAGALINPGTTA